MADKHEAYKAYISCLGGICGFCCCTYKRVETSTVGLIEKFGRFKAQLQPGLHYYNPCTENIRNVQLKTRVMDMRNQIVYTKDNISVDIDTSIFYRILNAYKATYVVKDIVRSLTELIFVTMRTICGEYVFISQYRFFRI